MKNSKMRVSMIIALSLMLVLTGCAKLQNQIDRDGALLGSTKGDWIVIKQSGGDITDIWKLEDEMVQSEENSDGWLFKDQNGNIVNVSGDTKAIRVKEKKEEIFARYVEYHMEFDSLSYAERYKEHLNKNR
jgi:hypothetical protein